MLAMPLTGSKDLFLQWDRAFDSAEWQMVFGTEIRDNLLQWDRAFDSAE